jgi:hypothetical protein
MKRARSLMFVDGEKNRSGARDHAGNIGKSVGNPPAKSCCEVDQAWASEHINEHVARFLFV